MCLNGLVYALKEYFGCTKLIVSAFQAIQDEDHQGMDKKITMVRWENQLLNNSFINCTQKPVNLFNFWSPKPSGTRSYRE